LALRTLRWALGVYEDPAAWRRMQIAGMQEDFSWAASAREYVTIYESDRNDPATGEADGI
jgi:starch synthase